MRSFAPVILSTLALTGLLWLVGPIFGAFILNFIGSLIIGRRLVDEIYSTEGENISSKLSRPEEREFGLRQNIPMITEARGKPMPHY